MTLSPAFPRHLATFKCFSSKLFPAPNINLDEAEQYSMAPLLKTVFVKPDLLVGGWGEEEGGAYRRAPWPRA